MSTGISGLCRGPMIGCGGAVGNVGSQPRLAPARLTGISIEKFHIDRMSPAMAISAFARREDTDHNVAWGSDMEADGLVMRGDILP